MGMGIRWKADSLTPQRWDAVWEDSPVPLIGRVLYLGPGWRLLVDSGNTSDAVDSSNSHGLYLAHVFLRHAGPSAEPMQQAFQSFEEAKAYVEREGARYDAVWRLSGPARR